MIAILSSSTLWYLTRGAGLVSLVLLTASVVMGILQVQRWAAEGWPRMVVAGLHKNLSLLVLVFLGLHIVTAIADGYVPIHWISVVIPFTSPYRPLWLGLGAIAVDLLIALVVTSLLRSRMSLRTWRLVHWAAYACWPVAFVHGLGTGSDGRVGWVQIVDVVCLAAVVVATTWRLASGWRGEPARRATASVAMGVIVLTMVGWAAAGPTKPGWARRAGTPVALLAPGTTTADPLGSGTGDPGVAPASTPANALTIPVNATLAGTIVQSDAPG
ncbi:MAG TPA: ferric reductase-like transmembrane domain-containing protein, partial [Acidimicrobiales bacterium]